MTNAEKEAREIVRAILTATGGESFPAFPIGAHAQRILRFAREYRCEMGDLSAVLERVEKKFPTDGSTPVPPLSPVEDTTPPGWTREPRIDTAGDVPSSYAAREWGTPEREKPF